MFFSLSPWCISWGNEIPIRFSNRLISIKSQCDLWFRVAIKYEPAHDYSKTCYQRRLRSACASAQSDQSLRWSHVPSTASRLKRGLNENSCHTGEGWYGLIWVFAGDTNFMVGFVMCRLVYVLTVHFYLCGPPCQNMYFWPRFSTPPTGPGEC